MGRDPSRCVQDPGGSRDETGVSLVSSRVAEQGRFDGGGAEDPLHGETPHQGAEQPPGPGHVEPADRPSDGPKPAEGADAGPAVSAQGAAPGAFQVGKQVHIASVAVGTVAWMTASSRGREVSDTQRWPSREASGDLGGGSSNA